MKTEEKTLYESPEVEIIAIEIEQGFAASVGTTSAEDGMWDGLN